MTPDVSRGERPFSLTGPYVHAPDMRWVKSFRQHGGDGTRNFVIVVASAWLEDGTPDNAKNGVAVLDEDHKSIVVDQMHCKGPGLAAPASDQVLLARMLSLAQWGEFVGIICAHSRYRDCLETGPIQWVLPGQPVAPIRTPTTQSPPPGDGAPPARRKPPRP